MSLRKYIKKETPTKRVILEDYYIDKYKKGRRKFNTGYHVHRVKKRT